MLATPLPSEPRMTDLVLSTRRFARLALLLVAFSGVSRSAHAQGIGFQGGATVDPEQMFVGTHFETKDIYQGLRFRPGIDGMPLKPPSAASPMRYSSPAVEFTTLNRISVTVRVMTPM